jgi:hypothetical protein
MQLDRIKTNEATFTHVCERGRGFVQSTRASSQRTLQHVTNKLQTIMRASVETYMPRYSLKYSILELNLVCDLVQTGNHQRFVITSCLYLQDTIHLLLYIADGGSRHLRNVGTYQVDYTA